jgi:hypothetical protein
MGRKKQKWQHKKTEAKKYAIEFENWRNKRLEEKNYTLTSRQINGTTRTYEATEEELKTFIQCYVEETAKVKYAKARAGLPEYWFISPKGTLLSNKEKNQNGEPALSDPNPEGIPRRIKYKISSTGKYAKLNGTKLDAGAVVNLCFGGKSTEKAEKLLNEQGLFALKKGKIDKRKKRENQKQDVSLVQLHHPFGYEIGDGSNEQIRENKAFNCGLERTQFISTAEHDTVTHFIDFNADKDKQTEHLLKFGKVVGDSNKITAVLSHGDKTGVFSEDVQIVGKEGNGWKVLIDGKEWITEPKQVMKKYIGEIYVTDENGTEIPLENIPEDILNTVTKFFNEKLNSEITSMCEQKISKKDQLKMLEIAFLEIDFATSETETKHLVWRLRYK